MTNNPNTQLKGQEKQVKAQAEADLAKLRTAQRLTNVGTKQAEKIRAK